nr:MAG TPA: Type-A lantibiotic [Caudoviricetes sp.]
MGDFAPLLTHHCPTASPHRFFAICLFFSDLLYFCLIF